MERGRKIKKLGPSLALGGKKLKGKGYLSFSEEGSCRLSRKPGRASGREKNPILSRGRKKSLPAEKTLAIGFRKIAWNIKTSSSLEKGEGGGALKRARHQERGKGEYSITHLRSNGEGGTSLA